MNTVPQIAQIGVLECIYIYITYQILGGKEKISFTRYRGVDAEKAILFF